MRLRKILMLPAVLSISAVFAFGCLAQKEDDQVNDKVRELQEQYRRLLKDEYNPSTIQPKTNGAPSFSSKSGWMNSSKKKGKGSAKRKSGKKKSGSRFATGKGKKVAKGRSAKSSKTSSKTTAGKKKASANASAGKSKSSRSLKGTTAESAKSGGKKKNNKK